MTHRWCALFAAFVLVACGGGGKQPDTTPAPAGNDPALSNKQPDATPPPPKAQTRAEVALAKFVEFEQKMCACTDADCAKRVSDEMTEWSRQNTNEDDPPPPMSEEQQRRAVAIGTHMSECMQRAYEKSGPSVTP